jgi:Cu2+-containing amine oxidase
MGAAKAGDEFSRHELDEAIAIHQRANGLRDAAKDFRAARTQTTSAKELVRSAVQIAGARA